jgi:lysophospholipase L1-like esterase
MYKKLAYLCCSRIITSVCVGNPTGRKGMLLLPALLLCAVAMANERNPEHADVVVYGGTASGVVSAVQAARMGKSVVLVEPSRHIGGMTSGGLGATDFKIPEAVGGISREFYQRVKAYYSNPSVWKYEKASEYTSHRHDPDADVMFHFEPHVAEQILRNMLLEARVHVVLGERLDLNQGVTKSGRRIESFQCESGKQFSASMFIDATYEGDLMARSGVPYHVGRESNAVYGETMNGVQTKRVPYNGHNFFRPVSPYIDPGKPNSGLLFGVQSLPPGSEGVGDQRVQAYCFRLCMTEVPENRVQFKKPADYDPSRYELMLRYLQSDSSSNCFPDHPEPREIESPALGYRPYIVIMPNKKTDMNSKGAVSSNLVGGNYEYPDGDYSTRDSIWKAHRSWHQGLLWFMQNDLRVPDKYRLPLQTWGLAKDEFEDNDHWPHQLYIREARRMIGKFVMTEHHCSGNKVVDDGVGLGCYSMDSHVTQRYIDSDGWVRNEGNIGGSVPAPYPISYRAIVPQAEHCENLLVPVCCSASHVAYGSIRMEPVYMILGQSAATAACLAISQRSNVQSVEYQQLQDRLLADQQRLSWPLPTPTKVDASNSKQPSRIDDSLVPIVDVPSLPRVLIIGDSVSMGYTVPTRKLLAGRVNLHRIPANAGGTSLGLSKLDAWLGAGKWDVIHFNFGLHDAKLPPEGVRHAPPEQYESNLRQFVGRLKKTGAQLIWASTTPVPNGGILAPNRRFGSIDQYNGIAERVMQENGIPINDLNGAVKSRLNEIQKPNDVHFTDEGSRVLAKLVADAIVSALVRERR